MLKTNAHITVVVPNWNGREEVGACLKSLLAQSLKAHIIVVDNGSIDGSLQYIKENFKKVEVIEHRENKGFAGGVNAGIRKAMEDGARYVALFNNDAIASKTWLEELVRALDNNDSVGIVTCKLMDANKEHLDSTGDYYTTWGLPYPRGRGEPVSDKYDRETAVLGGSGGASLYRTALFDDIGLFDEDFFAYYEDVDVSLRAQLAGWKVRYEPKAIAYHQIGATSGKIKGFTTYQTMKNLPLLLWKNIPAAYLWRVLPRFTLAYLLFFASAIQRHHGKAAFKGWLKAWQLLPLKLIERHEIQRARGVSAKYIWTLMTHDLPPNARRLRQLRAGYWRLLGKKGIV
ncbi:MAG TPA: glycosyltransferase family 2 protein [Candidatus Saccharimonadales bacterium]|nr:glycosyltransferase family 2 protein [Candidatus Saccharimonadales bacterium]